ncbi:MAG: hypothetical protein NVS2B6_13180 [Thermoleophilaceae bacterium]
MTYRRLGQVSAQPAEPSDGESDNASPSRPRPVVTSPAYCPHCFLLVEPSVQGPWPPSPVRCPHCKLTIGQGRAHERADGVPGARGAAAGVIAGRAREVEESEARDAAEICRAILGVAQATGVPPERLLMVEYQQHAVQDSSLPPLHEVLSEFGSWKRAQRQCVQTQ